MHILESFYRPDNYPNWIPWKRFEQKFNIIGKPSVLNFNGVPSAQPGFSPRQSFGKPPDDCDPTTGRRLRRGFEFQVKLSGEGHVILDKFRIHAQKLVERSLAKP
jgi:hypothetical protein